MTFDVDWLYESERADSFADGLTDWSTFNYINGIKGHCSYNRINGVALADHPDKAGRQVMALRYLPADTLVSDVRGAVWNFPAMRKGRFSTSLKLPEGSEGVSLVLNDRWFNPSDTVARHEGIYHLRLDRKALGIKDDKWHEVSLEWDLDNSRNRGAIVKVDGKRRKIAVPQLNKSTHGISYVHFMAEPVDGRSWESNPGILIESVAARRD